MYIVSRTRARSTL